MSSDQLIARRVAARRCLVRPTSAAAASKMATHIRRPKFHLCVLAGRPCEWKCPSKSSIYRTMGVDFTNSNEGTSLADVLEPTHRHWCL